MQPDEPFAHRDGLVTAALEESSRRAYEPAPLNTILARTGMSKGKQALYLWL
jgi:hypothetical protein